MIEPRTAPSAEASQRERLGGEAAMCAQDGEGRDPEQQENVDDVHDDRVRRAPDQHRARRRG